MERRRRLLVDHVKILCNAFRIVKQQRPFQVDAIVILPEHLHCLWTLPPDDVDYSTRWRLIKSAFSRSIDPGERISIRRQAKSERGLWQSFRILLTPLTYIHVGNGVFGNMPWDQSDFDRHLDYIHYNPVKHGLVNKVADWPHSSFHRFVRLGYYPENWAASLELHSLDWE